MSTTEFAEYLNEYLQISEISDYPGALNGLQVENSGEIDRITVAVDASLASIRAAAADGSRLLLVHHGLFWNGNQPVTGRRFQRLRLLLGSDIAVYSAHLPLDVHPQVGNNGVLARALGVKVRGTWGDFKGQPLGVWGELDLRREALTARLDEVLDAPVKLVPGGPEQVRRVGVITGAAGSMVGAARAAGLDALVTGEGSHHHFFDAMEGGINLYLGGHYATETWGVRALAQHLEAHFGLPWTFADLPTGL